jgi:hypothetical protein
MHVQYYVSVRGVGAKFWGERGCGIVVTANKPSQAIRSFSYVRGFGGFVSLCVLVLAGLGFGLGLGLGLGGRIPMELSWLSFFVRAHANTRPTAVRHG